MVLPLNHLYVTFGSSKEKEGNSTDRLSRMRTIYMLKIGSKVSNRSFGRKDAHFRGFYQSADNQHVAKNKGHLALFCIHFCLL